MREILNNGGMAHVIQLAVAPVFLLTAIGTLLSVMTNRLSRIIDRARALEARLEVAPPEKVKDLHSHLGTLSRRARFIGIAITLSTLTALLVCTVIAILFLSDFFNFNLTIPIALLFIIAMISLVLALLSFLREVLTATSSLRIGPE